MPHIDFLQNIMLLIPMLLSLTVHEWAHAISAHWLGDDTAARNGRLTLNPIVHIDPIGTFLLPLFGVPFGWAKPVPVNPARFDRKWNMSLGMALTASAGPISNLILAVLCAVALGLMLRFDYVQPALFMLLRYALSLNITLAVFNMIPIPPLDGSRIADHFMPQKLREGWESLMRFGPILLFAVILFGGVVLSGPISAVQGVLTHWIRAIAGAPV